MKKTYTAPCVEMIECDLRSSILETSGGGVTSGSQLGKDFNPEDINYTNEKGDYDDIWSVW